MKKIKLLYQSFEIINLLSDAKVPVGGAAVEWNNWLNAFYDIGCDVGLLTFQGSKQLLKNPLKFELVESYDLNKGLPKLRLLTYRIPSYYKAVKKFNPDFILQGCANANTGYFALISKLQGKPFIHRIGSDMDVDGRINHYYSKISQMIYYWGIKNANLIACQNKYQYNILRKKYPNKSISIIYNPYFYQERRILDKNSRSYVAWVGNFRYEKNLPALADIIEKYPDVKFKIAGTRFSETDPDSEKGLTKLSTLNNAELLGHISNSDVRELLSRAYCLLNTSRLEGFSNTFLEAWSVGTPVLSTVNVNPDEIISENNIGLIAENYNDLSNQLNKLLSYSDEQFNILSNNCVEYVKEKHDPIKLAKIFLNDILKSTKN